MVRVLSVATVMAHVWIEVQDRSVVAQDRRDIDCYNEEKAASKGAAFTLHFLLFGFLLGGRPVEVSFPNQSDSLNSGCLAERILIHGVGVAFESQFTIFR